MSFNLDELSQIAGILNINLPSKSDVKSATTLIKGFLNTRSDHVTEAMQWIADNSDEPLSKSEMDKYVGIALDFIEKTYPKYDDHTMYELLDLFEDEITRELYDPKYLI